MNYLPENYEGSWTLSNSVFRSGICLHSGIESSVSLSSSEQPGFYVSSIKNGFPPTKLIKEQILESQLCTTINLGKFSLSTVEHLLAGLAGCGLTHVQIDVSGEEIPLLDGSALEWVKAIQEAGIKPASSKRDSSPVISQPLVIHRGESVITATPADKFKIIGIIDFPYKAIGRQVFTFNSSPEEFLREIAPARTFGFVDQLEYLKKSGLIKGGNLDNALVCDGDHWVNPPLRFYDEPVRHKILDLIGDLAIVGFPKAQVLVYRGSHGLHADFASALAQNCSLA